MEIRIKRIYDPLGTNGQIYVDGQFNSFTIELPWRNNQRNISCIPGGIYDLKDHKSPTFGRVAYVIGTQPQRDFVYFHAANDAAKELRGCIAPVMHLTGIGKGTNSKVALERLNARIFERFDKKLPVKLIIE
jgi:hypothetical protein